MDASALCRECRAPLSAGVVEGLCPKCLLRVAMGTQAPVSGENAAPDKAHRVMASSPVSNPLPDPAFLARCFPQLEILELLGQGGMGAVYKARQSALDRLVALKVLPTHVANEKGFAERFTREARALARLSHPSIVAVYEFGQTQGLNYLVLEYVDGVNLRQLERTARLTPRQALLLVPQICEALQFAHDEGVVHRDIKPENVLVDRKGRVKITDFGLARLLGRETQDWRLTGAADVMGTPHYMAPEQVEHPLAVDHRADIYSLGVVLYEMLTGELPLGKFAPPSRKVEVDVRLDEVVLHALEKEPERRYQQASQVKQDVETITHGSTSRYGSSGSLLAATARNDGPRSASTSASAGGSSRKRSPEFWKQAVSAMAISATVLFVGTTVYLGMTRVWPKLAGAIRPSGVAIAAQPVDLLQRYPTTLTTGDSEPERAREWEFTEADVFRLARFQLQVGRDLRVELGGTDLGLGHCADGAVWAVMVPRERGRLISRVSKEAESVTQVWLRFHPQEVGHLFPRETVFPGSATNLVIPMQALARQRMYSSWQAGGKAMIPSPGEMTVDVDVEGGIRRFFMIDTKTGQSTYAAEFEHL